MRDGVVEQQRPICISRWSVTENLPQPLSRLTAIVYILQKQNFCEARARTTKTRSHAKYIWTRMNNGKSCTLARARTLWCKTLAYKRLVRAHLPTHAKSAAVVSSEEDDSSSNVPFIMSHAKPKTSWRSSCLTHKHAHTHSMPEATTVLLLDKRLFNIKLSDGRRLSHKVMTKDFFHDAVFISHTETRTRRTAALSVTDGNPLSDGA